MSPLVPLSHVPARVAEIAASLSDPGSRAVRIRLDPPSLGEIRVHVESTSQGITVRIVAESPQACALLADHQSELGRELWRHGLALQSFSTSVAGEGGDRAGAGEQPPAERQSRRLKTAAAAIAKSEADRLPLPAPRTSGLDTRA